MKKRLLIICSFFILFSCSRNEIKVDVSESLNLKDVKIELDVLGTDIANYIVLEDGNYSEIPNGYGENDWKVFYEDSLYFKFRHFKTNRKNNHAYRFKIDKLSNEELICTVKIRGKYAISWKSR